MLIKRLRPSIVAIESRSLIGQLGLQRLLWHTKRTNLGLPVVSFLEIKQKYINVGVLAVTMSIQLSSYELSTNTTFPISRQTMG